MNKVLAEILKVCKIKKQGQKEKEQKFLSRVLDGINDAGDETWDTLSVTAQTWYNAAAKAHNDGEGLPPFPASSGAPAKKVKTKKVEDEDEEDEDEDEEDEVEDEDEDVDEDDEDEDEDDEDEDDEDEDEEDEDEEDEDEEDEEPEPVSIDISAAKKGEVYTVITNEEAYAGKLTFRSKTKIKLKSGKTEIPLSREDITAVYEGKVVPPVPSAPKGKKATKKKVSKKVSKKVGKDESVDVGPKMNKREQVVDLICQFPKLSEEKMRAKVEKSGIAVSEPTFNGAYRNVHLVMKCLKRHANKS